MSPRAATAASFVALFLGAEHGSGTPGEGLALRSAASGEQGPSAAGEEAWRRRWKELPAARPAPALQRRSDWMLERRGSLAGCSCRSPSTTAAARRRRWSSLREHLADYEAQLAIHLGSGAQACWRGPRLFDTPESEALVARWVRWYREHRRILESDLIHVRRADGRDLDYMVQVDPDSDAGERAFALIHNPLQVEVERELRLPLHYSGLRGSAWVRERAGPPQRIAVDERADAWLRVRVPAGGRTWLSVSAER
jgi:hypothetical protein